MGLNQIAARLVEPVRWIIIGGIAFTLANAVLFFVAPPESENALEAGARPAVTADRRPAVSINAILARNLFGEADGATAVVDNTLPAVETRLPLELRGVFVADQPEASVAIVAQKGREGMIYVVGDTLPGNAELVEVTPDHIVLQRAGARETLTFPQIQESGNRIGVSEPDLPQENYDEPAYEEPSYEEPAYEEPAYEDASAASPRDVMESYRDRIEADPQGTLQDMGISAVADGAAQGYRLDGAAVSSPYLSQTGLQPGDVVLSVNGQPVGNIEQDRRQIDNILAQGSARIEVQRGTRRFFVTASLKP